MKIQNNQNCTTFGIKKTGYVYKILRNKKTNPSNDSVSSSPSPTTVVATAVTSGRMAIDKILKNFGITYCEFKDNIINIVAGYNGGFFSVRPAYNVKPELLKMYFVQTLINDDASALGGLVNYKNMVQDLKRQDIIQKGLQIHTYKLNNNISKDQSKLAAKHISKLSSKYIKPNNLFYIDSEAFYYDNLDKTAFSVDATACSRQMPSTFRACKFETDENGNIIGFSTRAKNIFKLAETESTYKEQQEPSCKLPAIAEPENNKLFAEAFRFGNAKNIISTKIKNSTPLVLKHLSERVGVKEPTAEKLQIVKIFDEDKNILKRICYYDATTGRSLVYNDDGKYLYQMEYNKDLFGNIIACSKF